MEKESEKVVAVTMDLRKVQERKGNRCINKDSGQKKRKGYKRLRGWANKRKKGNGEGSNMKRQERD